MNCPTAARGGRRGNQNVDSVRPGPKVASACNASTPISRSSVASCLGESGLVTMTGSSTAPEYAVFPRVADRMSIF